jgi:hypothetical protein
MTTTTTHPTFPLNNNLTTVSIGAQFGSPHWISDTSTMQSWFCKTSAGMYDSAHFFTCAIAALLVFSFKSFSADGSLNGPGILCVCLRAYNYIFFSRFLTLPPNWKFPIVLRVKKEKKPLPNISERARAHTRKPPSQKATTTKTTKQKRARSCARHHLSQHA